MSKSMHVSFVFYSWSKMRRDQFPEAFTPPHPEIMDFNLELWAKVNPFTLNNSDF